MAKKALISTVEPRESGYRVAQVEDAANTFEVAAGLMWVDCADNVVADQFWYDPTDQHQTKVYQSFQTLLCGSVQHQNQPL